MSDTGTLAVVSDGGRRVVEVKVKVGGGQKAELYGMGEGRSCGSREMRGGRGSGVKWDFRACK